MELKIGKIKIDELVKIMVDAEIKIKKHYL